MSNQEMEALRRSIREFGFVEPIVAQAKSRIVIGGHQRLSAAIAEGLESVPVYFVNVDDKRAKALNVALNRIHSDFDEEMLTEVLAGLDEDYRALTGFAESELERILRGVDGAEVPAPKVDKAAELAEKWGVKLGQVWQVGKHRLMCGDSLQSKSVAKLMKGEKASLCATDPPYLVSYDATNHPSKKLMPSKNKDWHGQYAELDVKTPLAPFYEGFIRCALGVCDPKAAFYIWYASQRHVEVEASMVNCGILVHQQTIWFKSKPTLTHSFYMWAHEPCLFGWLKGNKPRRNDGEFPTTVWEISNPVLPGKESRHPTEKPIELFTRPMLLHTQKNDLCYEPFSGSGTSLAAAQTVGRRCYAMELSPGFVAVTIERMKDMGLKPKLVK